MTSTLDKPEAPALSGQRRPGDAIFRRTTLGASLLVIVFLAGVAIFLTVKGLPALDAEPGAIEDKSNIFVLVGALLFGTILAAAIAMIIVTPLAIGLGLVISHYAPRRLAKPVGFLVDLLAAVPSVVFGLWGIVVLSPYLKPVHTWLADNLGFLPFFDGPASTTARTLLTASVVLALMALPIVTAIMREVFAQTPRSHQEAALALGATRWEMIRMTVLPYARSGMVAALLLGLGRALGETMAVAMVLTTTGVVINFDVISQQNSNTVAAFIALNYKEASPIGLSVLIFAGLALFLLTFLVNFVGRGIATRGLVKG